MIKYFTFQWHITDRCDQRCKHCYIYSKDGDICFNELGLEDLCSILDNIIDTCDRFNRKPYLSVTGGDPLLHPQFWSFAETLRENGIPFNILGNPFHLDSTTCKRLHECGCQKYQLSIDGIESTHDYIRKNGSFRETLAAIPILQRAGIKVAVMTTVSSTNFTELPQIIDTVVSNKADIFAFARYCPVNGEEELMVSAEDYHALLDSCWKKFIEYKDGMTSFNLKDHLWTLYLYENGLFEIDQSLDKDTIYEGCSCGINHMTILSDGTIYACRRMDSPVGNALSESLYSVFLSERMNQYRKYDSFHKCSKCELLRFCRGCPAVAYGITHDIYADDPQCWKIIDG